MFPNANCSNGVPAPRNRNNFTRGDGIPFNNTLVKISDWCKNSFGVVSQFCINTDNSHHRYDVMFLIKRRACCADRSEDARHQIPDAAIEQMAITGLFISKRSVATVSLD